MTKPHIEIEHNVPIPPLFSRARQSKYPWRTLEIGDSFVANANGMQSAVSAVNTKLTPKRFVARKLDAGVFRIWRIE